MPHFDFTVNVPLVITILLLGGGLIRWLTKLEGAVNKVTDWLQRHEGDDRESFKQIDKRFEEERVARHDTNGQMQVILVRMAVVEERLKEKLRTDA